MSIDLARTFTHDAATPAVLILLKDGMVQKAILYGSTTTAVYVREEGRGGFGVVPIETATDFLAFDDRLTLEPEQIVVAEAQDDAATRPAAATNGATVLAITVKT
jgi:hypothetical protein